MDVTLPIASRCLPADAFPFTIVASNAVTGAEVWRVVVTGRSAVHVPGLARQIGAPVTIAIHWPDGTTTIQPPPASPEARL